MENEQYLQHLERDSGALADAAAAAGPEAAVPSCPGWTVEDLLRHCASGDRWARTIVETGSREHAATELPPDAPTGAGLVGYFRENARALHDTLAAADPGASVWTFSPADRTARFWYRRRAQETGIHRVDAELAAGETPPPADPELAVDGIDEFLTVFLPRLAGGVTALDGTTVHLHCTDTAGEWLIVRDGDDLVVTREHAKGDVAARGSASDLLRFLWGRGAVDQLEVFGDAAALARFRDEVTV
jgi:uncharacterized protein (TIGR03083 family)